MRGPRVRLSRLAALMLFAALVATASASGAARARSASDPPPVALHPANGAPPMGHVWYIMLENSSYAENFGPAAQNDPKSQYLAKTLPSQGALLTNYYGLGHISLDNWMGAVSGQPGNFGYASLSTCTLFCPGTQLDCPTFTRFLPGEDVVGGNDYIVNANG